MHQSPSGKLADSTTIQIIRFGGWRRYLPMLTMGWVIWAHQALVTQGWVNGDGFAAGICVL